jgi:hypothetical protein
VLKRTGEGATGEGNWRRIGFELVEFLPERKSATLEVLVTKAAMPNAEGL